MREIRRHNHANCADADVACRRDGRPETNSGAARAGTGYSIRDASLIILLAGHERRPTHDASAEEPAN